MGMKRLHLLWKLKKLSKLKQRLKELEQEYQKLRKQYQPEINELSVQANTLALDFKELFRHSQDYFLCGNKHLSEKFLAEGSVIREKCEKANATTNEMRRQIEILFRFLRITSIEIRAIKREINFLSEESN